MAEGGAGKAPLFGLFSKIKEAVVSTRELLADPDLRSRAMPFVISEGNKVLQELQQGLSKNAAILGQQIRTGMEGRGFAAYISRLLTQQPSRTRVNRYQADQLVSVWVGRRVVHGAPQQLRSRLWFAALEHPDLTQQVGPICPRELLHSNEPASLIDDDSGLDVLSTVDSQPLPPWRSQTKPPLTNVSAGQPQSQGRDTPPLIDLGDSEGPAAVRTVSPAPLINLESDPLPAVPEAAGTLQAGDIQQKLPAGLPPETDSAASAGPTAAIDLAAAAAPSLAVSDPFSDMDSVHAAEDDVLQFLETARTSKQQQQQQATSSGSAAGSKFVSGLVSKVTAAVDRGREQVRGVTSASAPERTSQPQDLLTSSHSVPKPAGMVSPMLVQAGSNVGSAGAGISAGADGKPTRSNDSLQPSPAPAFSETDTEWELLDAVMNTPSSPPVYSKQQQQRGWHNAGSATSNVNPANTTEACMLMLQHLVQEVQSQQQGSPNKGGAAPAHSQEALLQLLHIMEGLPWQDAPSKHGDGDGDGSDAGGRGRQGDSTQGGGGDVVGEHEHGGVGGGAGHLVCEVPEDCRYLTLNEMTAGQEEVDDVIQRDINRTFPEHPMFSADAGQQALFRLLKAYSLHDLEVGYCQGMAFAAGVLLMYLPEEPAFRLYCWLMGDEAANLRRLYLPGLDHLKQELHRFEQLLAATQPALQAHLEAYGIPPVLYVSQWIMTTYACPFSPSFCAQVLDIMVQDAHDTILIRVGLCIMDALASQLLQLHDFEQLLTTIKATPADWDEHQLTEVLSKAVYHTWAVEKGAMARLGPDGAGVLSSLSDPTAAVIGSTEALAELVLEGGGDLESILTPAGSRPTDGGVGASAVASTTSGHARLMSLGSLTRLLSKTSYGTHAAAAAAVAAAGGGTSASGEGVDEGGLLATFAASGQQGNMNTLAADDLQLDHEIAQMVLDLKLRMPSAAQQAAEQTKPAQ